MSTALLLNAAVCCYGGAKRGLNNIDSRSQANANLRLPMPMVDLIGWEGRTGPSRNEQVALARTARARVIDTKYDERDEDTGQEIRDTMGLGLSCAFVT